VHTRPDKPRATREPLQFGAEIYGHAGLEADLEVLQLALECLKAAQIPALGVDLADARIARALLALAGADAATRLLVHQALAAKDVVALRRLTRHFDAAPRDGLQALVDLYGDHSVLAAARQRLPALAEIGAALDSLQWLAAHLGDTATTFDLADLPGYTYYSGMRFSVYAQGASEALARGGRYDEVGAVFGRNRPAVGFSLDVKALVGVARPRALHCAIRAPWGESASLREAVASLRQQGLTVVSVLPGHENEVDEFQCDRELTQVAGQWVVQAV
jgi:ATP phosphoribosyltransferase regulatory subunit